MSVDEVDLRGEREVHVGEGLGAEVRRKATRLAMKTSRKPHQVTGRTGGRSGVPSGKDGRAATDDTMALRAKSKQLSESEHAKSALPAILLAKRLNQSI